MASTLYETDFYNWIQEQSALLKAGRLSELDIENLIEEIETVGRSEQRECKSRLTILLMHLLKWQYQPDHRCNSWKYTLRYQRKDLLSVLKDSPSLKTKMTDYMLDVYPQSVADAAEETGVLKNDFLVDCQWTFEQVIDDEFFPE